MKDWAITTTIGDMLVGIDFFKTIDVKSTKIDNDIITIYLKDGHQFSLGKKDWSKILQIVRLDKIRQVLS